MLKALTLSSCLAVAFSLASIPGAAAQQSAPADPDRSQDQSMETLKVRVNVVQLFFNVKDKKGGLIPSQTKDDFEILEDGKPQTIKYFTAESNLPLTLGILIDSSGSQARVLEMEKEVGGAFLNDILRDKDEAFVIDFDVNVDLLQDFTNDVRRLKAALNKARINTGGGGGSLPGLGGGPIPTSNPRGTLLYDAVYLAAHDQLAHEVGRKAMIAGTFAISGFLLLLTAYLFAAGFLTPVTQTIAWFSIFFFASAAASSACCSRARSTDTSTRSRSTFQT